MCYRKYFHNSTFCSILSLTFVLKIFLFSLILSIHSYVFSQNLFQKAIGGNQQDAAYSIIKAINNGYIICGFTSSFGAGGKDVVVINIDDSGNIIWAKTYGGLLDDYATNIIATNDGNYLITANSYSFGQGAQYGLMIKIDVNGNLIWAKYIGSSYGEYFSETLETENGYLLVGRTYSINIYGNYDNMLIYMDKSGNIIWDKSFATSTSISSLNLFGNIIKSKNNNFILTGYCETHQSTYQVICCEIDINANIIWSNLYVGGNVDVAHSVSYSNDGNYIVSGFSNSFGNGDYDCFAMEIDTYGNIKWSKAYGGNGEDRSLDVTLIPNKGYVLTGYTESFGYSYRKFYVLRIDNNGNLLWSKAFGGKNFDGIDLSTSFGYTRNTVPMSDKGLLMCAYTESFGNTNGDVYVIKTDSLGNSSTCATLNPNTSVKSANFSMNTFVPVIQSLNLVAAEPKIITTNIDFHDSIVCKCPSTLNIGKDTSICQGNSITLDAGLDSVSYTWNDNSHDKTLTVNKTGIYSVTVTEVSGCSSIDSIKVTINSVQVNLGKDTTICQGNSIILNAGNAPATYLWNDNSTKETLRVNKSGLYSVTVTDKNGCQSRDSIDISSFPSFKSDLNLGKDTTICEGCILKLDAGNKFIFYKWQDGSTDSVLYAGTPGTYWVIVKDQNGCSYSDSITVKDFCLNHNLFIPNCFTPNGDGKNDTFKTSYSPCVQDFNMKIFNRWGELLFETDDLNKGWDGSFNHHSCPDGVYIYVIIFDEINDNQALKQKHFGTVTLLY